MSNGIHVATSYKAEWPSVCLSICLSIMFSSSCVWLNVFHAENKVLTEFLENTEQTVQVVEHPGNVLGVMGWIQLVAHFLCLYCIFWTQSSTFSSLYLGIQTMCWCGILVKLCALHLATLILLWQIDTCFCLFFTVCWRYWCKKNSLKRFMPKI